MLLTEAIIFVMFVAGILVVFLLEVSLFFRFAAGRLGRRRREEKSLSRPLRISIHLLTLVIVSCLAYGYFIEPRRIEVKRLDIRTDKFKSASVRIVQISDLHCYLKEGNEKRVVELVNSLRPDVIVFTGDTVNAARALPLFQETMRNLNAGLGKFAVTGNYEIWFWSRLRLFANSGFRLLDNETVKLTKDGEDFYISGLGYEYPDRWYDLLKGVPYNRYSVFLYHTPDLAEEIKEVNVDLYLAGHTHGGQVALPFYGALITLSKYGKRYEAGEFKVGNMTLYVNRGIGMAGEGFPRVRFFCGPEITVFDIHPQALTKPPIPAKRGGGQGEGRNTKKRSEDVPGKD